MDDSLKWVIYIAILSLIFYIIYYKQDTEIKHNKKRKDGEGKIYRRGRGHEDENIELLLERIYWSTYLHKRVNKYERIILTTILILVAFVTIFEVCSIFQLLGMGIIIFTFIYIFTNLMYVHGDIHNDGNVRKNIRLLEKKLKLKLNLRKLPPPPICGPLLRIDIE